MYNVFCGSSGRQSDGCDAARTSAMVLPAADEFGAANSNGPAANAIRRSDFDMAFPCSSGLAGLYQTAAASAFGAGNARAGFIPKIKRATPNRRTTSSYSRPQLNIVAASTVQYFTHGLHDAWTT